MAKRAAAPMSDLLKELFDAERAVRRLHDEIVATDSREKLDVLARAVKDGLAEKKEDEQSLKLARLAGVLGEMTGDRIVDLLIDILGAASGEARYTAGEALTELAFDRFKEVALGIERALDRLPQGSPALGELPFVLLEVPEPGVTKLLEKFLASKDPDAVAAAIEASAELGDPALAKTLDKLRDDKRAVEMEDDEGEVERVTIGKLAAEAHELLADAG
jgi:HEAT repeat protein